MCLPRSGHFTVDLARVKFAVYCRATRIPEFPSSVSYRGGILLCREMYNSFSTQSNLQLNQYERLRDFCDKSWRYEPNNCLPLISHRHIWGVTHHQKYVSCIVRKHDGLVRKRTVLCCRRQAAVNHEAITLLIQDNALPRIHQRSLSAWQSVLI